MSNPNKQKGTAFESAIRDYLRSRGIDAYRPAQEGYKDVGDLHGVSPFVLQAKNYKDLATALREGVDGVQKQKVHARERYGAAVIKRARKGVSDAYVVVRLEDFADLLLELRAGATGAGDSLPHTFTDPEAS